MSRDISPGCRETCVRDVLNHNTAPATPIEEGPLTCGDAGRRPFSHARRTPGRGVSDRPVGIWSQASDLRQRGAAACQRPGGWELRPGPRGDARSTAWPARTSCVGYATTTGSGPSTGSRWTAPSDRRRPRACYLAQAVVDEADDGVALVDKAPNRIADYFWPDAHRRARPFHARRRPLAR